MQFNARTNVHYVFNGADDLQIIKISMNDYYTVLLNKMCSPDMTFGEDLSQSEEVDDSPTAYNLFEVYTESMQQQIPTLLTYTTMFFIFYEALLNIAEFETPNPQRLRSILYLIKSMTKVRVNDTSSLSEHPARL